MSVWGVLGGAAVLGVLGGVLLSRNAVGPDESLAAADQALDRVLPSNPIVMPTVDITTPDPLSLRGVPQYPGAAPRRVTGSNPHAGALNAISWFSTTDSVDHVISFYEQIWSEANLIHTSHRFNEKRGYVSWLERPVLFDGGIAAPGEGLLHMVTASDEGSQTIVTVSATEPLKLLEAVSPLPDGVKLPAGAGRPQVIHLGEVGEARLSVFAPFTRGRQEVADELEAQMKEGGWSVDDRVVAPEGRVTIVARRGDQLQIAAIDGTLDSAQVLITLEPRAPTGAPR